MLQAATFLFSIALAAPVSQAVSNATSSPPKPAQPRVVAFSCAQPEDCASNPLGRIHKIAPVVLPDGRMLLSVGDTIYMLGLDGQTLWRYSTGGNFIVAQPLFNPARNEVALIAMDGWFIVLNAQTGNKLTADMMNGAANYSDIQLYNGNYLLVLDMSGYRSKHEDQTEPDGLLYQGATRQDSWTTAFPKGAKLLVVGTRIMAVTYAKHRVLIQQISIPKRDR